MKNRIIVLLCLFLIAILSVTAIASTIVSPALNVIAKKNVMIKSGLVNNDIYFSKQDFMKCLGITGINSITVNSLPEAADGVLKLGNVSVTEGQRINNEYLSVLRFVPTSDKTEYATCVFGCNGTEVTCTIKYLEEINYAPAFANDSENIQTYCNVSLYGTTAMNDPDGDKTHLQVVSFPKHGTVRVTNSRNGNYVYTPTINYIGKDEFVVVACDEYGNYSNTQTISVEVSQSEIFFTDAKGHWCENAAISLYEAGAVEAVNFNEGMAFYPEDKVTREEFVVMTMKALGMTTLTDSFTSFADNSSIDVAYRPYIATAQRMGYINGKEADGIIYFDPKGCITKSEAAVVINNMLGYEEGTIVSVFSDDSAIPTWAKASIYALRSAGVFNGNDDGAIAPSAILSRAQTVQMLYNITK